MKTHTLYLMANEYSFNNCVRFDVKSDLSTSELVMVLRPHYKWFIKPDGARWWIFEKINWNRYAIANSLEAAIKMLHTEDFNMYTEKTVSRTKSTYVPLEINEMLNVTKSRLYDGRPILLLTTLQNVIDEASSIFKTEEGVRKVIRAIIAAKLDEECGVHIKLWNHKVVEARDCYAVPTMNHYILLEEIPESSNLVLYNGQLCIKKEETYTETMKTLAESTTACYVDIKNQNIQIDSKQFTLINK